MNKKDITKEYNADGITVIWKPGVCIHAGHCVKALPKVYNPKRKPWIETEHASKQELIDQIETCPSGALSYKLHIETEKSLNSNKMEKPIIAQKSPVVLDLEPGKNNAWCACGRSANQPWCDGSHKGTGITPTLFKVDDSKQYALCRCKQTSNPPFCDGTHNSL